MAYTVPDIATAEQCEALGQQVMQDKRVNLNIRYRCLPYQTTGEKW